MGEHERTLRIERKGGGPALDAVFVPGSAAAAVVAPPHPEYGGRMDNPVVTEIVRGLRDADVASLRFDWRGVGRSDGAVTGDPAAGRDDYAAAFAQLVDLHPGPFIAAGYSFGAATALGAAAHEPRFTRLVLVSPPVGMYPADFGAVACDVLVVVGDDDAYAPLSRVESLVAPHPRVRLEILRGGDHFFSTGLDALASRIRSWTSGSD